MAVWTAPATWANSAVTATQMNTEIRDHLVWLKAFADLITEDTADDEGTSYRFHKVGSVGAAEAALVTLVVADSAYRFILDTDGRMTWGAGATGGDVGIWRSAAGILATDGQFRATDGVRTLAASAAVSDGSFVATPENGMLATSNLGRIYFRYGSAWHYVAQTAGFEIPEDERDCPRCKRTMQPEQRVLGRIDKVLEDGARHGLWEHFDCEEAA